MPRTSYECTLLKSGLSRVGLGLVACCVLLAATPAVAQQSQQTLVIPGTANIFGAGHAVAPDPGGGGGGTLPPVHTFTAAQDQTLTVSDASGEISGDGFPGVFSPPDGRPAPPYATDISSWDGIGGVIFSGRVGFLVGVFLDDTEPADPAPPQSNETNADNEVDRYPVLRQVFFVGNGLVGTNGEPQRFHVPAGATRLYLGIADAGSWYGPPGTYEGNLGEFTATVMISASCQGEEPSWTFTGSMSAARPEFTLTVLQNGLVLAVGGNIGTSRLSSAELYDPTTGTWSPTGSLNHARGRQTATLLPSGKVLVTGGYRDDNADLRWDTAELYDPTTGAWSETGSMHVPRVSHTATLLPDGKVLVAGGHGDNAVPLYNSAELYDPATGVWSLTGNLNTGRQGHTATLLPNGRVLVAGGADAHTSTGFASAELYDPATGTWSATGSLNAARAAHTETLLQNGKVLVACGFDPGVVEHTTAEIYDPATGVWTVTASSNEPHSAPAILLPSGKVLVAGSLNAFEPATSAELYDPAGNGGLGAWEYTASLNMARASYAMTLLPNSKVLVAGGYNLCCPGGGAGMDSAELYDSGEASGPCDSIAPTTVAARSPLPNGAGWNNSDVTVTLTATDNDGGAGVQQIVYSATGAQEIPSTVVSGPSATLLITAEGATTLTYHAVDNASNAEPPQTMTIRIDKTAPTLTFGAASPSANAAGWNNSDVSFAYTVDDTLSGVSTADPASPLVLTAEGADVTGSVTVTDVAGNSATFTSPAVRIDKTPPAISILAPPNGAVYLLNSVVTSSYSCSDGLSGVAECVGPVANGANINTTAVGAAIAFTVTAKDRADNAATLSSTYAVQYQFIGFLQPVDNLPIVNAGRAGRTYPIKWQVRDANGTYISDLSSFVSLTSAATACDGSTTDVLEEEAAATGGTLLRYDPTTNQFIYNWKTNRSWTGCRLLKLTLKDGTTHTARFRF
jgi:hypothetical protein